MPACYVNRIVKVEDMEKRIEFRTVSTGQGFEIPGNAEAKIKRERIVRRAAMELDDGMNVNLGIGIPTLCSNFLREGVHVTF